MTATAMRRDVETLWRTFGRDGRPLVAGGAVALRAELAFEAAECEDAPTRRERVQEALRYLPRPIFVYATKKDDVADLASAARELGMDRVVTVTGDSGPAERSAALDALRGVDGVPPLPTSPSERRHSALELTSATSGASFMRACPRASIAATRRWAGRCDGVVGTGADALDQRRPPDRGEPRQRHPCHSRDGRRTMGGHAVVRSH